MDICGLMRWYLRDPYSESNTLNPASKVDVDGYKMYGPAS